MKKPKNAKAAKQQAEPKKRGRPPGSGKKAAAKAPKQTKAEKDKAKGEQRQAAALAAAGAATADSKLREAFLVHFRGPKGETGIVALKKRITSLTGTLRGLYKEAKRDGFTKEMFDTALLCESPEGEAKVQERLTQTLQAAQFAGSFLGKQLDMFQQPDRTPAVDIARSEGQKASMENKAALPPYDPSTPQYRAYMEGFHEHQATLAGFKAINPAETTGGNAAKPAKAPKAAKAEKAPAAPPAPAEEAKPSATVVPITRAQVIAQQQAQGERLGDVDADEADGEESGFGGGDENDAVAAGGFSRRN